MAAIDDVKQEVLAAYDPVNHPLPVTALWAVGSPGDAGGTNSQYTPNWQLQQVQAGRHMLPTFAMPEPGMLLADWTAHYQSGIQALAAAGAPVLFIGTQIEQELYTDSTYFSLPYPQNPNAWVSGAAQAKLSPFGSDTYWGQVGAKYGAGIVLDQLQSWYPSPPRVVWLLNNEAQKLSWVDAETDQHYLDLYGTGHTDDFKREVFATAWVARYAAMLSGLKNALTSSNWRNVSFFYGYEGYGIRSFGYGIWRQFSLYYPNNAAPESYPWDGSSPSYYLFNFNEDPRNGSSDFNTSGPQVMDMNYVFMFPEVYAHKSNFWFELSTWNGIAEPLSDPNNYNNRLLTYTGQVYTPARYGGFIQWAMWLLRPRAVRDFHFTTEARVSNETYFAALMDAVDRVYSNATLTSFWRTGTLVADTSRAFPLTTDLPTEYASAQRMFMLPTNLDSAYPWGNGTENPVYALARVKGTAPNRQWLLYAWSPTQNRGNVQVTITGYKSVTVQPTIAGSFWLVDEATDSVANVLAPADVSAVIPRASMKTWAYA